MRVDRVERPARRERALRTLTFWLRPAFVLRVLTRFQRVAGFDRAIALASSALTALVPIAVLVGAILPGGEGNSVAESMIRRYQLTGAGAQALRDALAPAGGTTTQISVLGAFVLIIATLSFSRSMQRLFEQTWELKPLSVRNSFNALLWIGGVIIYMAASWWVHHLIDTGRLELTANLVLLPLSAAMLAWSGRVLSALRITWRALAPFAVLGAVALAALFSVTPVYLPHLFTNYASRYGVIGAVLAMVSALFILMLVIVASAAVGREVTNELERIDRGERPPDDEIRQEWDNLIGEARLRTEQLRAQLAEWRTAWRERSRH